MEHWSAMSGTLNDAVVTATHRFATRNAASRQLYDRAQRVMPGGNTRSALHFDPFPLYIARSADAYVYDADGHRYLDVLGEFTAGLYGHSNQSIVQAAVSAAMSGLGNGAPGTYEIELAELLCDRIPSLELVRFCNSGTEATLYSLSLAKAFTGRSKFLCFSGAYHGGVFVFSGGGNSINAPYDWHVGRYNCSASATAAIETMGDQLAAVIVEPMMSNGGCIPATPEFLRSLRSACSKTGALLIFDEIVTSRHGAGGMQGLHAITPDLTTLGKYIGGGFSFGAFGGRADIMERMNPTRPDALPHAGTFNNNVFSMTAGAVALRDVFTAERAALLLGDGDMLRERLNALCRGIAPGAQFTGIGSTMNIHFCKGEILSPEDLENEPKELLKLFHFDLMEHGVYAARRGQINLSLPMTTQDFDVLADAVRVFLDGRATIIDALTQ
jgi:glutamate-1-semialdehyde 2,1-aminomutase